MIRWFMKGSTPWFILSVIFSCVVALADLILPKIIQYTADSVIGDDPLNAPQVVQDAVDRLGGLERMRSHLVLVAGIIVAVAAVGAVSRYLMMLFNSVGSEKFVLRMRDRLFSHILRLPYSWHSRNHTGDIIQRCTSDVDTIKIFVSEQLTSLVRVIMLIVLSMYFMININWKLALIEGTFIPVIVIGSFLFYSQIGRTFLSVDSEEGKLSDIAQENLTGIRVVRAFGRESFERERFEKQNEHYTNLWFRLMRILASFWVMGNVMATMRNLLVILCGTAFVIHGSMTTGGLIAFISYNALISLPVRGLGRIITEMSKAGISIDRLRYIMNAEEEQGIDCPEEDGLALKSTFRGDICFEHVSFDYRSPGAESGGESGNGETPAAPGGEENYGPRGTLRDVTFTVPAGKTVGILGATGSGKSTLLLLLDRLYDLPEEGGRITIGGRDIRDIPLHILRENIGLVLQEPYLFSGTLSENIGICSRSTNPERIRHSAKIASLDETIENFSQKYETYVGERGVTLSGGQKQRTAIAQMLVRETPVMAFDDSLSAVDADTDRKIRTALKNEIGSATVLIVAHRITTLMQADEIIVLDGGRVAERGTHEELISQDGIYRQIFELQTKEST